MPPRLTRTDFKTYIRRRLGEPVITINVSDDQMEDRINDALSFYQDYHYDASEKVYLKHQVSTSTLTIAPVANTSFVPNEVMVGQTSGARLKVYTVTNTTSLQVTYQSKMDRRPLQVGETITGQSGNVSTTVVALTLGDWDNEYFPVDSKVFSVNRLLPLTGGFAGTSTEMLFSFNYQFLMSDMSWLTNTGAVSYYLTRSHLQMLSDLFNGGFDVRYNRHANRLYVDCDWSNDIWPGQFIVVEAQRILDPADYADVWSDRFLADYATALVRRQWGMNLMKYEGIAMPGGVTLNGRAIYDEAVREIEKMESEIQLKYEIPPSFITA